MHGDLKLAGRYGRYRNNSSRYSGHYTVATTATGPSGVGSGEAAPIPVESQRTGAPAVHSIKQSRWRMCRSVGAGAHMHMQHPPAARVRVDVPRPPPLPAAWGQGPHPRGRTVVLHAAAAPGTLAHVWARRVRCARLPPPPIFPSHHTALHPALCPYAHAQLMISVVQSAAIW